MISPEDSDAVRADDALIERLRAGGPPDPADPLPALLAAWRDFVRQSAGRAAQQAQRLAHPLA
ncbi:hypothetical protein GCM10023320_49970 [Pseudonocardia adelaidensis]|uniref:Uncharacterized protein n=1 Tax=Pseudonocardia adelaidensis TaxID=648754 RepID=A0ABP9NUD0_9PSEU